MELLDTFLEEAADLMAAWQEHCLALERHQGASPEVWAALFRVAHTLKGSSAAVGLGDFSSFVHQVENYISLLQAGTVVYDKATAETLSLGVDVLEEWLTAAGRGSDAVPAGAAELFARVAEASGASRIGAVSPHSGASAPVAAASEQKKTYHAPVSAVLRVRGDKVEQLTRAAAQLTIAMGMLAHRLRCTAAAHGVAGLALAAAEIHADGVRLHDLALTLRLEPLAGFFSRMEKIARDVARSQGKEIEVVSEGREIELDKTVSDRIVDPFVHLIRNAVDHGIEPSEVRQRSGKPARGKVQISAQMQGSSVVITVCDDGAGIDAEAVYRKAKERGLAAAATALSRDDKLALILAPGFSTAEVITDISGRGVGMDVVASSVGQLGGALEIRSELGRGSQFIVTLPANVSMSDSLVIKISGRRYVVPQAEIERVVDGHRLARESFTSGSSVVLRLDGQLVPIVDLRRLYGGAAGADPGVGPCLVVGGDAQRRALAVDQVVERQDVIVQNKLGFFDKIPGVTGCVILSSGEPCLMLSPRLLVTVGQDKDKELL